MVQNKGRRNPTESLEDFAPLGRSLGGFRTLLEVDEGCGVLKDEELESDVCDADHKWVCQKEPLQLPPLTAGDSKRHDAPV